MEFKTGDIVKLKSGGPDMTVNNVSKDYDDKIVVNCVWFDDKKRNDDNFYLDSLIKVKTENTYEPNIK